MLSEQKLPLGGELNEILFEQKLPLGGELREFCSNKNYL